MKNILESIDNTTDTSSEQLRFLLLLLSLRPKKMYLLSTVIPVGRDVIKVAVTLRRVVIGRVVSTSGMSPFTSISRSSLGQSRLEILRPCRVLSLMMWTVKCRQ